MALHKPAMKRLFSAAFQFRSYSAPAERSIPAAKQKYVPASGTYPKGFLAGSAHAGVKPSNTKHDDIALVVSEQPCPATAVFTRNLFKAAPVKFSKDLVMKRKNDGIRGVVVNSGCANAVTGKVGNDHAVEMARTADACFESTPASVEAAADAQTIVMSTGVIGQQLPIDRIKNAIPEAHALLGSTHEHWMNAAQAICTTDTFPKLLSRTFTLPSHPETEYRIAGMTKGAGMIHPNMGTLLGIICTDAKISPDSIRRALRFATDRSFNCISIDGDTSTNDTVALFANGAAAPPGTDPLGFPESAAKQPSRDQRAFANTLKYFMTDLAKLVVRDGEGATKFVTVRVQSDVSALTARRAASSIVKSSLVKTALYGKDANWGRILCAIGYAQGIIYNPGIDEKLADDGMAAMQVFPWRTSVSFIPADGSEELKLLVRGEPEEVDEGRAKQILEMEDLEIFVRLDDDGPPEAEATENVGPVPKRSKRRTFVAVFWTCDFSHEYVTINGDYRT